MNALELVARLRAGDSVDYCGEDQGGADFDEDFAVAEGEAVEFLVVVGFVIVISSCEGVFHEAPNGGEHSRNEVGLAIDFATGVESRVQQK